jgi:hypothetical protein
MSETNSVVCDVMYDIDKVNKLQTKLEKLPQVDAQTQHHLSGKIYARTMFITKGTTFVGSLHKRDHINIICGDMTVTTDEGVQRFTGYQVIPTKAGMKRAGIAHEDTYWTTLCYTEEIQLHDIEDDLVEETHKLQTRLMELQGNPIKKLGE